jgi:FkbM family methyltransferase
MKGRFLWRALKTRFRDQSVELGEIRKAVRPGDTVCDVGANKGGYLLWLSRWVKSGRVIAFEPQENLAQYLSRVCRALHFTNVVVENKAVFSSSGRLTLYVPGNGDSPGASLNKRVTARENCRGVSVQVVTLDDYLAGDNKVSVLKIDVEGAEPDVFKGAEKLLVTQSPLLVFECENRHLQHGSVQDVFPPLERLGYSGQFVCGQKLLPISQFKSEIHQREIGERFWDAENYCNNFVFKKKS